MKAPLTSVLEQTFAMCYTICMKDNLIHYRTSVCNINYHVVWSVKYRRRILTAEIEAYLKDLVQEIAEDKGFVVQLFECGDMDHVHCFITAPPKFSVTVIVKYLKGITGRKLFEQFPEIKANCGTTHIIARQSALYPKKISKDTLRSRANLIKGCMYAAITQDNSKT